MTDAEQKTLVAAVATTLRQLQHDCSEDDFVESPTLLSSFSVVVIDSEELPIDGDGAPRRRAGPIIVPHAALADPKALQARLSKAVFLSAQEGHPGVCDGQP